jgi:tRNA(Ile)-lysidine synthase
VRHALRTVAVRLPDVFAPQTRLLVAFSGGQDSTCLLHALAQARRQLDLLAVHVDHGLRADSAEAAERAASHAEAIGVHALVARVDVPGYRARLKRSSIQQAARAARYQALARVAEQQHAAAVLVAHTADDQAETVLLNLLRGTGMMGLAGMRLDDTLDPERFGPVITESGSMPRSIRLVRPLLRLGRPLTLAYCTGLGLPLVEDASNQTLAYTRNRVRLELLPMLERFNPAIRDLLARTADLAADDLAVLDVMVADVYAKIAGDQTYDLPLFRSQPRALQRRLLRLGIRSLGVDLVDVADAPIEDTLDLLQTGRPNQTYHLPYGVELFLGDDTYSLRHDGRARHRQPRKSWDVVIPRV